MAKANVDKPAEKAEATPPAEVGNVAETDEKYVTKADFQSFQQTILAALDNSRNKQEEKIQAPVVVDNGSYQTPMQVPEKWRAMADAMLGKDFVIELELPEKGGQKLNVYVPRNKSNAPEEYWEKFKQDKRTRELGNTGIEGVRNWLLRIRKNLLTNGIQLPYFQDSEGQRMVSVI